MEGLSPCTHEEADKMLLYMLKMPPVRGEKCHYKSTDTDVIVIWVTLFNDLNVEPFGLP